MENKQSEAKLMKLLSVLQDHLSRDREDEQALMDFQLEFSKAIETHKLQIKKILKTLDQNKQVKTYLTKHLYEGVDTFYKNSLKLTTDTGDAILQEGRQAESRVAVLTQAILDELQSEVKEEKREVNEEKFLDKSDPQWKNMDQKFKKEDHRTTQDEKDVEAMIEHFKENIEEVSPPQMTKAEIQDAENLMLTLQEQFKNGASKHLPRNEAAIREKMIQIMKKSKFVPYGQHAGDVDYEKDTVQIFQELIHAAKFGGDIPVVEAELKDWEKDKKTDAEVLLDIEKEVEDGKVDPIMLHEGETAKEGAEMLEMGTEDHRDDPKAAVPMPDAAEQIADAMEPAAEEGQENP